MEPDMESQGTSSVPEFLDGVAFFETAGESNKQPNCEYATWKARISPEKEMEKS